MTCTSLPIRTDCIHVAPRRLGLAAAIGLQLLWSGCSPAPDKATNKEPNETKPAAIVVVQSEGPVVAKINGVEVREGDLKLAEDDIGQQMPQMPPESKRDYLVTYLGDMILLTKAAEDRKIGDSDDFKRQLEFTRKKLLMAKLLDSEAKAAQTEAAMRKIYDDATKQMKPEEEVHARHILVESEDEAKAVREELDKGADFAELAKTKSKDPSAAAEGGDLGFFSKEQMVPEFAEAAFKLDKGQTSEPVKSPFGWHIIRVEEKRTKPLPDFEQVKPQLETFVVRKAQSEYLAKLREGVKIERLDKPAAAPAAPAASPMAAPEKPAQTETKPDAAPAEPEKK
jgi:peptidyl-prolyl cis-trans isomerase C